MSDRIARLRRHAFEQYGPDRGPATNLPGIDTQRVRQFYVIADPEQPHLFLVMGRRRNVAVSVPLPRDKAEALAAQLNRR